TGWNGLRVKRFQEFPRCGFGRGKGAGSVHGDQSVGRMAVAGYGAILVVQRLISRSLILKELKQFIDLFGMPSFVSEPMSVHRDVHDHSPAVIGKNMRVAVEGSRLRGSVKGHIIGSQSGNRMHGSFQEC